LVNNLAAEHLVDVSQHRQTGNVIDVGHYHPEYIGAFGCNDVAVGNDECRSDARGCLLEID
jgi:hypothetical protein